MPKKSDRVFARSGFDEHRDIDDIKIHLVMNIKSKPEIFEEKRFGAACNIID